MRSVEAAYTQTVRMRDSEAICALQPGRFGIIVGDATQHGYVELSVAAGDRTIVELDLQAAHPVRLRRPYREQPARRYRREIRDAAGRLVERLFECWPPPDPAVRDRPQVFGLPSGSYRLIMSALDGRRAEASFTVPSGPGAAVTEVDLTMPTATPR